MSTMNKFSSLFRIAVLYLVILLCLPSVGFSQPGGGDDCHTYNDPFLDCPIDGGVTLLLAIGIGYGVKKYKERGQTGKSSEPIIAK